VDQFGIPRWEWRAFAPSFDVLDPLMPAEFEIAHEIYILNATTDANVKIRGGAIDSKTLEKVDHGLELWKPTFKAPFPLCQRDVREVCRHLGVAIPAALFLPCYSAPDFIVDIACCMPGIHVIGVNKTRRHLMVDGCSVERASVSAAGKVAQTAAIESPDAGAVLRLIRRLELDRLDNVNYVEFLKSLLAMQPVPVGASRRSLS
jgi:hypothetical protein